MPRMESSEHSEFFPKKFTWREVAALNNAHNAHVIYKGKVYNVSSFVSSHPGGADQISMASGHDITHVFPAYHHKYNSNGENIALKTLKKYYVGDLIDSEMPSYADDSVNFYETVRKRVHEKLKSKNIDPKIDYKMFSIYFIFATLLLICWYNMIKYQTSWLVGGILAVGWAFFSAIVATIGHDTGHCAVTHSPAVWRILLTVVECLTGLSTYLWIYRHNYGHHGYTNVDGLDPDLETVEGIWRNRDVQPWIKRYNFQHCYMPFLYSVQVFAMKVTSFSKLFYTLKNGPVRVNPPGTFHLLQFFGSKLFHLLMFYGIPLLCMPWIKVLVFGMIYELTLGFLFSSVGLLSHVSTELTMTTADKNNKITDKSWVELQILSTKDYDTKSWLCTLLTGGLNHQTAHHLFPDIIQSHYYHITPVVYQTCREFGIQYHHEKNIAGAVYQHIKHMLNMGQKPNS